MSVTSQQQQQQQRSPLQSPGLHDCADAAAATQLRTQMEAILTGGPVQLMQVCDDYRQDWEKPFTRDERSLGTTPARLHAAILEGLRAPRRWKPGDADMGF
jgi:hypothetical protein